MRKNVAILAVLWIAIAAVWIVGFRWESIVADPDPVVREIGAEGEAGDGQEPVIYSVEAEVEEIPSPDKAAASSKEAAEDSGPETGFVYVVNTKTKKIHLPDCASVGEIKETNRSETDDPAPLLDNGYSWCKRCHG